MGRQEGTVDHGIQGTISKDGEGWEGLGSQTCHSQTLQLPQAQEGTRLHRADDVVPQVPVGGKWGPSQLSRSGGHTLRWDGEASFLSAVLATGFSSKCPQPS